MSRHRSALLMAILIGLLGFYIYQNHSTNEVSLTKGNQHPQSSGYKVIEGNNEIENIEVISDTSGIVKAKVDYFFTGAPMATRIEVKIRIPDQKNGYFVCAYVNASIGKNSAVLDLHNPRAMGYSFETSPALIVEMFQPGAASFTKELVTRIEWPSAEESRWRQKVNGASLDDLYRESVTLIDLGQSESIKTANNYLNHIILKKPDYAPAYLELARISMKTNWNDEGLLQAEKNILTSLQLENVNPNANILLGYVYTHQKRYKEAEQNFITAEKAKNNNRWLWSNWGELYKLQNDNAKAISKYIVGTEGERSFDTYDRARLDAYRNLFQLLNESKDKDKLNSLYQKRAQEFSDYPCMKVDYAKFRLTAYGDYESAIAQTQDAINSGCQEKKAKQVMGLSSYYQWSKPNGEFSALAKARAFYPESASLFYDLAKNQSGTIVLKKLVKEGTQIDIKDRNNKTALAEALLNGDYESSKALIELGANVNALIGDEQYPVSFIPLMLGDKKLIDLMKKHGIDYSKLSFNGISAEEFARQFGKQQAAQNQNSI